MSAQMRKLLVLMCMTVGVVNVWAVQYFSGCTHNIGTGITVCYGLSSIWALFGGNVAGIRDEEIAGASTTMLDSWAGVLMVVLLVYITGCRHGGDLVLTVVIVISTTVQLLLPEAAENTNG